MCLMASYPTIYHKGEQVVDGVRMFDGGYSDPIPVREAIKNGSKKLLVIRTRP